MNYNYCMDQHTGIPRHVAIIPDGNRRWANGKGLPTFEGHRKGFAALEKIASYLRKQGVQTLTVWAFSTENWSRDPKEVAYLMEIYESWLRSNLKTAHKEKIRIVHLGRKDRIPASLQKTLQEVEGATATYGTYYLAIALDYGGHDELIRAVQTMQRSGFDLQNENDFNRFLDSNALPYPNPDLIIRTSGEQRTSGFMSWQSAYSEYIFLPQHLPDVSTTDIQHCLEEYQRRQRRFGR